MDVFKTPQPELLRAVTALEPEPGGVHVRLDSIGVRSTQRLAIGDLAGTIVVGLWPAELKPQAEFLYEAGRALAMIDTARRYGWSVDASPHLAFHNSHPTQRLYMAPDIDAADYAERWQGSDSRWIGQHPHDDVQRVLWPWLKSRGYASEAHDSVLDEFLSILGNRPAHLRPGLRLRREWNMPRRNSAEVALAIRHDVDAILVAAGESALP